MPLPLRRHWLAPLLLVGALGCSVGDDGPAPAGSPAAEASARAARIAALAEELGTTAKALTSLTDESRRKVADGRSTTADEIEKMRLLTAQLDAKEAELRREMEALESALHAAAGDPAWPQDEAPGRR